MRLKPQREFYIPAGSIVVRDKLSSAVAYLYQGTNGKPSAVAFQARRQKPEWRFYFRDLAARERRVREHFESVRTREAAIQAHRSKPRALAVGDVLRSTWGYDQTNVDYYQVTELVGSSMVEIREIGQDTAATGSMSGRCVPAPDRFIGEPMRKRADGDSVRIASYAWAYKIEPKEPAPGVRVYESSHWSSDH